MAVNITLIFFVLVFSRIWNAFRTFALSRPLSPTRASLISCFLSLLATFIALQLFVDMVA